MSKAYRGVLKARINKIYGGDVTISKCKKLIMKELKKSSALKKISAGCKAAAKRKFKVWPSAYASGWGVRCTRAGGPGKMGKSKK